MNCEKNKTVVTGAFVKNKNVAYHAILKDMQHLGFSDMKYAIPFKSQVGKLDPAIAHDTVCSIHLEFFDTYLKKTKDKPAFESALLGTGAAAHFFTRQKYINICRLCFPGTIPV